MPRVSLRGQPLGTCRSLLFPLPAVYFFTGIAAAAGRTAFLVGSRLSGVSGPADPNGHVFGRLLTRIYPAT